RRTPAGISSRRRAQDGPELVGAGSGPRRAGLVLRGEPPSRSHREIAPSVARASPIERCRRARALSGFAPIDLPAQVSPSARTPHERPFDPPRGRRVLLPVL